MPHHLELTDMCVMKLQDAARALQTRDAEVEQAQVTIGPVCNEMRQPCCGLVAS